MALVHGMRCKKYISKDDHKFHIDEYGYLQIYEDRQLKTYSYEEEAYCIENHITNTGSGESIFLCTMKANNLKFQIVRIFMVASCFFLLLTIVGYLSLPKLLNLFGKTLICYCCCLFVGFVLLCIPNFTSNLSMDTCKVLGEYKDIAVDTLICITKL